MTSTTRKESKPRPAAPRKRVRRSNVDRSAETRRRILDATVSLLHTQGYRGVTNTTVADAAGVSRGAMMHHFPSRLDLLAATVRYAYDRIITYRQNELDRLPPGLPRFRAIIDLAWTTARMPEGLAVNEIRIGTRGDEEATERLAPMMTSISRDYGDFIGHYAKEAGLELNSEIAGLAATTALSVRSLSVGRSTPPNERMVENVIATLHRVRESIIAGQLGEHAALPLKPGRSERRKPDTVRRSGANSAARSDAG